MMDIGRLKRLRRYIARLPASEFDMSHWIYLEHTGLGCGTVCCLAGHTLMLSRKLRPRNNGSLTRV